MYVVVLSHVQTRQLTVIPTGPKSWAGTSFQLPKMNQRTILYVSLSCRVLVLPYADMSRHCAVPHSLLLPLR